MSVEAEPKFQAAAPPSKIFGSGSSHPKSLGFRFRAPAPVPQPCTKQASSRSTAVVPVEYRVSGDPGKLLHCMPEASLPNSSSLLRSGVRWSLLLDLSCG